MHEYGSELNAKDPRQAGIRAPHSHQDPRGQELRGLEDLVQLQAEARHQARPGGASQHSSDNSVEILERHEATSSGQEAPLRANDDQKDPKVLQEEVQELRTVRCASSEVLEGI